MKSQNTKSSDQLKREVDQQIKKVNNDLDSIQGRLTPGQFIDDAIFYKHGRSLGATFDHLKRNPIGTTFLSLGTLLLMEDESNQTMEYFARMKVNTVRDSVISVKDAIKGQLPHKELSPGTAPSAGDIAKGKVSHLKDAVQSKVQDLKEKMPSTDEIKAKVSGIKSDVSGKVGDLKQTVSSKVDDIDNRFGVNDTETAGTEGSNFSFNGDKGIDGSAVKSKVQDFVTEGRDRASELFSTGKESVQNLDPMTYMALGAGLGALTGAALPVSDKESQFVQTKLDDKISGLGSDLQDAINECSSILKDLVVQDVKDYAWKPFSR